MNNQIIQHMKDYNHKLELSLENSTAKKLLNRLCADGIQCSVKSDHLTDKMTLELVYTEAQRGRVFSHYCWLLRKVNPKASSHV